MWKRGISWGLGTRLDGRMVRRRVFFIYVPRPDVQEEPRQSEASDRFFAAVFRIEESDHSSS